MMVNFIGSSGQIGWCLCWYTAVGELCAPSCWSILQDSRTWSVWQGEFAVAGLHGIAGVTVLEGDGVYLFASIPHINVVSLSTLSRWWRYAVGVGPSVENVVIFGGGWRYIVAVAYFFMMVVEVPVEQCKDSVRQLFPDGIYRGVGRERSGLSWKVTLSTLAHLTKV